MRILIVDDEPDILKLNRYILQSMGYEVLEAGNGDEALALFENYHHQFDLVILDLTMPVMDGMMTFEKLREKKPQLKVILITGFDALWDLNTIISQPNVLFLKKPYTVDDLLETIQKFFSS